MHGPFGSNSCFIVAFTRNDRSEKLSYVLLKSYFILLKDPNEETFEKIKKLLLPYLNNFVVWLIPKNIVIEFLNQKEIQVWYLNKHNLENLNSNSLQQLWNSLTDESYKRI